MILNILNELSADNSKLAKLAILKREFKNELLKKVIVAALNPYVTYYIKKIPDYTAGKCAPDLALSEAIDALGELSSRTVTGQAGINHLGWILQNCSVANAEVIERIIGRDLKCGVDTSPNKIWEGLIPTFDVMLSHKDCSGIRYPAFAQTKMDAARAHVHFDGSRAVAWSRSGKEYHLHGALDYSAKMLMKSGETFDGELIFTNTVGELLDRKTSNGIANKAIKGTLSEEESTRVVFVAWDIVDFSGTIPYVKRWNTMAARVLSHLSKSKIRLCNTVIVANEAAGLAFFEEQRALGEEGTIEKNMDSVWQPKRTKDLGKRKAEEEADLLVVGFNWGEGKFEGQLGSLECETADGLLSVNVSGMDDETRFKHNNLKSWIGKIITVRYNEVITKKSGGQKSLFLPRYIETRFDKSVANLLKDLK